MEQLWFNIYMSITNWIFKNKTYITNIERLKLKRV